MKIWWSKIIVVPLHRQTNKSEKMNTYLVAFQTRDSLISDQTKEAKKLTPIVIEEWSVHGLKYEEPVTILNIIKLG